MKRRNRLLIMGAVLALTLVLTLSVTMIDHKMEHIRESGETILSIPSDQVTALSWVYDNETLSFTRDETWHYTGDADFPVSESILLNMLDPLQNLSAAFRIEEVEDYSQYGFEAPVCTIGITAGDQDYQIRLGAYSKMDEQRYVDIGDGNVYLVFHDPLMEFDKDLSMVIENDDIPYLDKAEAITFTGKENYQILRDPEGGKSHRKDDHYYAKIGGQLLPLDSHTVQDYISDLTLTSLSDYVTYTASQEDLSQWGLDAPELSVQVDYLRNQEDEEIPDSFVLHLARDPEALKEAQAAEDPDTVTVPVYARLGDSELVYELNQEDARQAETCSYNDLRHYAVFPAETNEVTALSIQLDGSTYLFQGTPGEKEEDPVVFTFEDREVDLAPVLSSVRSLYTDEFTEEAPTGKLELRLDLTLKSQETVTLELYRQDGTQCIAKVDGKVVSRIPRTQVVDLAEAIHSIVLAPVEETEETKP